MHPQHVQRIIIIGGGAAGYFSAIQCASILIQRNIQYNIQILEFSSNPLQKVAISGGGRCNIMHNPNNDIRYITSNYPRGEKQLIGAYMSIFGPYETYEWFRKKFDLKIESDGRVFPASNQSSTVINALQSTANEMSITCNCKTNVRNIQLPTSSSSLFTVEYTCKDGRVPRGEIQKLPAERVIFATGSSKQGYSMLSSLGHDIIDPKPSLFTFKVKDMELNELNGISVPTASVRLLLDKNFLSDHFDVISRRDLVHLTQYGPVLITHQGLSGPAILRLSSFGARVLAELKYAFTVEISWLTMDKSEVISCLKEAKLSNPLKKVGGAFPGAWLDVDPLPKRLWVYLLRKSNVNPDIQWKDLKKSDIDIIASQLCGCKVHVDGRAVNKDEFVTAGGVNLDQVNMNTMESKIVPGIFFAGEVLNIDGVTGGFNFQAAWTTGHIAGTSCANSLEGDL